jgi:dynein heavy chain 1, cytosolic
MTYGLFLNVQVRQSLDTLMNQLNELPARLRTYSSYEHVKRVLKAYTRVNFTIGELKSEAVKERHWKRLMRQLRVTWVLPELTLGHLWDIDLQKNEAIVKDVLLVAQGEMALEEFLKQVNLSFVVLRLFLISMAL